MMPIRRRNAYRADGQLLLGFDPEFDYTALTREGRGRRVLPAAPEGSLLLSQWQHGTLQVVAPASAATTKTFLLTKPAWGNG